MAEESSSAALREFSQRYENLVKLTEWAEEEGLPSEARRTRTEAAQLEAQECLVILTRYVAAAARELERR